MDFSKIKHSVAKEEKVELIVKTSENLPAPTLLHPENIEEKKDFENIFKETEPGFICDRAKKDLKMIFKSHADYIELLKNEGSAFHSLNSYQVSLVNKLKIGLDREITKAIKNKTCLGLLDFYESNRKELHKQWSLNKGSLLESCYFIIHKNNEKFKEIKPFYKKMKSLEEKVLFLEKSYIDLNKVNNNLETNNNNLETNNNNLETKNNDLEKVIKKQNKFLHGFLMPAINGLITSNRKVMMLFIKRELKEVEDLNQNDVYKKAYLKKANYFKNNPFFNFLSENEIKSENKIQDKSNFLIRFFKESLPAASEYLTEVKKNALRKFGARCDLSIEEQTEEAGFVPVLKRFKEREELVDSLFCIKNTKEENNSSEKPMVDNIFNMR